MNKNELNDSQQMMHYITTIKLFLDVGQKNRTPKSQVFEVILNFRLLSEQFFGFTHIFFMLVNLIY